jgi:20S proteasome alpha/beta subunit
MTCIIGLEAGDDVYVGGDSESANGWDIKVSRLRKVFRVGDFLIGYTGFRRSAQLIEYFLDPPSFRSIHQPFPPLRRLHNR